MDLVYAAEDGQPLINRIESRNGLHTLETVQAKNQLEWIGKMKTIGYREKEYITCKFIYV